MTQAIALAIVLFALAFLWMIWLRQYLRAQVETLKAQWSLQVKELQFQLDRAPIFLEKTRHDDAFHTTWMELRNLRTQLSRQAEPTRESLQNWKSQLRNSLGKVPSTDWVLVDAQEDLQESLARLEKLEQESVQTDERYNQLQKKFPYSVAFAIFGFRKIEL